MRLRRIQKGFAAKAAALVLAFLLFHGNLAIPVSGQEKRDLEGPFKWATGDFQAGKYHNVLRSLELLLSYYEDGEEVTSPKGIQLKGKIHLLLGATYEKLRSIEKARQQYRLAKELIADPVIENVALDSLPEYRAIFMKSSQPLDKGIIIKPKKKKRKRISPLLILATAAVIVGGVAFALIKNKKKEVVIDVVPDFDTRELGIQWVGIPEGEFLMGDNFNEGNSDELPVHAAYLSHYRISRFEITFDQYDRFCEITERTKPYDGGWGRGNRPVINITWTDANAFCTWLSGKTGKNIHLPNEAQWEKAARGTGQLRYPWGNQEPNPDLCNYNNTLGQTQPVGSYPGGVSPYGVYDMAGNVTEWCRDMYQSGYYLVTPYNNPANLVDPDYRGGVSHVIRGGSWEDGAGLLRTSDRDRGYAYQNVITTSAGRSDSLTGFRIVLED